MKGITQKKKVSNNAKRFIIKNKKTKNTHKLAKHAPQKGKKKKRKMEATEIINPFFIR